MKNAVHNGSFNTVVSVQTFGTYFVFKNLPPELKLAMKMPYLVFFSV